MTRTAPPDPVEPAGPPSDGDDRDAGEDPAAAAATFAALFRAIYRAVARHPAGALPRARHPWE